MQSTITMKFFKYSLSLFAALLITCTTFAQDIHFSQFYMSPMNLNPALTGVMNCNTRFTANYRSQWASVLRSNAYKTYSVGVDQRIPVGRNDYFGIGGTLWNDQAGELNYATLTGKISAAYSKKMGGSRSTAHYLVVGAEAGLAQRSVDFLNARYGTQNSLDNPGNFDGNIGSGEEGNFNGDNDNIIMGDISAGLLWFSVLDDKNNFYLGTALSHLNRADLSFNNGLDNIYTKFTLHGGGEFSISPKFGLTPNVVILRQGPSTEINFGTAAKFRISKRRATYQSFSLGPWLRLSNTYDRTAVVDALILASKFDYNNFTLGFSYDVNVSTLSTASGGNGGFEFSLVYKLCPPERRGVYCPTF